MDDLRSSPPCPLTRSWIESVVRRAIGDRGAVWIDVHFDSDDTCLICVWIGSTFETYAVIPMGSLLRAYNLRDLLTNVTAKMMRRAPVQSDLPTWN